MSKLVATKYKHNKLKTMMIDWYIGKRCNFACSYCADFIHDNYSKHVPFDKMKMFVDKIVARYGTNVHWSLTGGEPTLNPDFIQLLEYLQDKKYQISVCTNGSRTIEYMYKMYELVDNITYSLHFEHITPKLNAFTEKALQLETFRREWNSNIPKDKEGWDIGQIQPKQFIARFMVLPGFNKEIADMTAHFKEFGIQKIEHRVIRPQKDMFVAESKVKTEKGNYKWKTKPSVKDVDQTTKVAPDWSNASEVTEIYEREEIVKKSINKAKEFYNIKSFKNIISVGDGIWDLKTARNLGLHFIGIGMKNYSDFKNENIKLHIKDWNEFDLNEMEKILGIRNTIPKNL